jgi:hypothetical protein
MAFRLIEDMGVTFTTGGTQSELNLEDEDVEIRQRLFWSCYFWDKMVSLYLGRTPMLQNSGMSPDQIICECSPLLKAMVWLAFQDMPWVFLGKSIRFY